MKLLGSSEQDVYQGKDGAMCYYYNLLRITIINNHLKYFLPLYQMDNLVSSLLMLNTTNTEVSFDEV